MDNKNLAYGRSEESNARAKFLSLFPGVEFIESGLVICQELPFIGATPDGIIINEDGIRMVLEIKSPISCENQEIKVPYLKNGELLKNHQFYLQCQIQMLLCKCDQCIFFVYSAQDYKIVKVEKDESKI